MVNAGCGSSSRSTPPARCSTSAFPTASPATSMSRGCEQAVEAVAVRHPILRTTYQTDSAGDPYPVTRDDLRPDWAEHDLSGLAEQARRLRLEVLAQRQFRAAVRADQGFTAAGRGRASGRRRADAAADRAPHRLGRRFVGAVLHRSHPRLRRRQPPATPVSIAADPTRSSDDDQAYWRSLMTDLPEPLELPGPNGSVVPSTWRAQRATTRLSAETIDRAAALARETGATPYMVLMAGVRRAGPSLHARIRLPGRHPGAESRRRNRERDRLLRQHRGDADAAGAAADIPRAPGADPGQRCRRARALARRPGMAGAGLQPGPQARGRANDAGQLRITGA